MNDKFNQVSLLLECDNYCERHDLCLDVDEYEMMVREADITTHREFEPGWKKWITGGLGAAAGYYGGRARGAMKGKGSYGKGWRGLLSIPIGIFLATLYRKKTDRCKSYCGKDKLCYYKCYADAADKAISKIRSDIAQVKSVDDEYVTSRMHAKLLKQLKFYEGKRAGFIAKVNKIQASMKARSAKPDTDVYRTRTTG